VTGSSALLLRLNSRTLCVGTLSVSAAERFDAEFGQAMRTIASDPERFPKCDERHHYYLMRHFPYQIIYRQHQDHWVVIPLARSFGT